LTVLERRIELVLDADDGVVRFDDQIDAPALERCVLLRALGVVVLAKDGELALNVTVCAGSDRIPTE
jgi:hypothetical protein